MIQLMKFKDSIVRFVGQYEIYVLAVFRFVVGFVAFRLIIGNTGYMAILSDYPFPLILALLCCFLPAGVMVFAAAVVILLELYALSMILCLIVAMIFLIMFCAYLRFTTRKGMYLMLTPILSVPGIPFVMPVAAGLLGEPYAVISVICGGVTYFILKHVTANAALFLSGEEIDTSTLFSVAVSGLLMDWEMYLYLIAFAAAAVITFCFRKLRINASHLLAAALGILVQLIIIAAGSARLDSVQSSGRSILLGCVLSFLILLVMVFFLYGLNYARVENVQFEDDDYYYYVRAIPKHFTAQTAKGKKTGQRAPLEERPVRTSVSAAAASSRPDIADFDRYSEGKEADAVRENRRRSRRQTESELQTAAAAQQLATDAVEQAAAAAAAEQAAVEAVAERAAAAAQAIYEAAENISRPASSDNFFSINQDGIARSELDDFFGVDPDSLEEKLLREAEKTDVRGSSGGTKRS